MANSLSKHKVLLIVMAISILVIVYLVISSKQRVSSLNPASKIFQSLLPGSFSMEPTVAVPQDTSLGEKCLDRTKQRDKKNIHSWKTTTKASPFPSSKYPCRTRECLELFSEYDKEQYEQCTERATPESNGTCHFINGAHRSAVALVSFPGSGNTWVRGLLEKTTGVCTGAMYCDRTLRGQGFTGEYVQSGSVLVVKTHEWATACWADPRSPGSPGFGGAILIVRNPFDALVAERTRKNSEGHAGVASATIFKDNPDWLRFIKKNLKKWISYFHTWIGYPTLVISYEELKEDTIGNVERMLNFLRFPYNHSEIEKQLATDFEEFKRPKSKRNYEHFTETQMSLVNAAIMEAVTFLEETFADNDTLSLRKYLR